MSSTMRLDGTVSSPAAGGWTGARVARPVLDLARSTAFYRDLLGLPTHGGFEDHDGYDGVFFGLPGGGELEITTGPVQPEPGTDDDLLVLYVRTTGEVRAIGANLAAAGAPAVQSANPYWNRFGQTFLDPDGYRIVVAQVTPVLAPPDRNAGHDDSPTVEIGWHVGPREELRPLFELAEDSPSRLDQYLREGNVLVATRGSTVIGHLQLAPTGRTGEIELKNMAVLPAQQGSGVGRALVVSAIGQSAAQGWAHMVVGTAAADVGNLRFYQRVGFRLLSVDRDAFTPATGYPDAIMIDGIPLLDRVWLSKDLHDSA
jgi:GNAT superfamily N-acetyltransferase